MRKYTALAIWVISLSLAEAQTLWDDNFPGYIAGKSVYRAGDIITVVIDSGFALDFSSASKDAKSVTFEFKGGEYGNLLNFLPKTKTATDRSLNGKEKYNIKTEIATRVTELDPTGKLVLTGTKVVSLAGKQETFALTGRVDPKAVDGSGRVSISKVENIRLTYTSFLDPHLATITAQDILSGEEGQTPPNRVYQLSEQKKRELLLLYLNRLIDILFR